MDINHQYTYTLLSISESDKVVSNDIWITFGGKIIIKSRFECHWDSASVVIRALMILATNENIANDSSASAITPWPHSFHLWMTLLKGLAGRYVWSYLRNSVIFRRQSLFVGLIDFPMLVCQPRGFEVKHVYSLQLYAIQNYS